MKISLFRVWISLSLVISLFACDKNNNVSVFFSPEDDVELGAQVAAEIESDPQYQILSRTQYPEAYQYLDSMVNAILNTNEVAYRNEFVWDVHIVRDDNVLNAFATPGGYIYVYTGLIKYLDNPDALAGVLGHEIAHADLRHTSRNLQKQYGVQFLLNLLLGEDPSQLEQIAGQVAGTVAGLQFSREYETEADEKSVEYLAPTGFACDGAKIFFQRIEEEQGSSGPEFLSTHPSPSNRVENIEEKVAEENCSTQRTNPSGYVQFVNSLP
ncbi:MAG: peptidase M48 [Owenweeksia sp.]|nr:peptidase M48 [Owenweeksia sp.]MBF98674.1 peptidase M48 [Owenweeksia sp.]HBF19579.1 peptidase M48 [Cryomorphaceae bacterium]|tara:strand:- start:52 stop:858 length:807 start_codon:yes stop_codon:yes gene_type:complete